MSNPFANSPNDTKDFVKDQTKKKAKNKVSASLKEISKMASGFEICEDGSILVGTPQIDIFSRSKRQMFGDILRYKLNNKILFYGEGSQIIGDIFIDEFLKAEVVGKICIDDGFNILELGREYSLRCQITEMKKDIEQYHYYKLFNPNNLAGSKKVIERIVRESSIGIITCFFNLDQLDCEEIEESEALEYFKILEACDVNGYNIPVVCFIEAFDITAGLFDYADIVINVDFKYEEDRRIECNFEKPCKDLFESFYLYEDGTFVDKTDSLKPQIMDELGKRVIYLVEE